MLEWLTFEQEKQGIEKQEQEVHQGCDDTHTPDKDGVSVVDSVDALRGWFVFC